MAEPAPAAYRRIARTCVRAVGAAAAALAVLTGAACADETRPDPRPASSTPVPSPPSALVPVPPRASPSPDDAGPTRPPAAEPASRPPGTRPATSGRSAGVEDRTGDLVAGRRTLTGTVDHSGDWVLLRTSDGTWALLGSRAGQLRPGSRVTVTGRSATAPAGCPAARALTVYSVR